MRILCTGDVHIGRRSSKIPALLGGKAYPSSAAWLQVVDIAIAQRVDLVVVSGDLVDETNKYYEAIAPIEQGLRTLGEASIGVVAVAGNHDHGVLPRLAESTGAGSLQLLGAGGQWQRETLRDGDKAVLHVDGWSFPAEAVRTNPLVDYDPPSAGDVPVLGVVHADAGVTASTYAPVPTDVFLRTGCAAWVLGHIHGPRVLHEGGASTPLVFYPGSPQALDPGEEGPHGVTLLTMNAGKPPTATHIRSSRVRYDTLAIDLSDVADAGEFQLRVPGRIKDELARSLGDDGGPDVVSVRLRFTGRTSMRSSAVSSEARSLQEDCRLQLGSAWAAVESFEIDTRPAIDLDKVATGDDPPAVLAALLRKLDHGETDSELDALVQEAHERSLEAWKNGAYLGLPDSDPSIKRARRALRNQTIRLLEELLAQKGMA